MIDSPAGQRLTSFAQVRGWLLDAVERGSQWRVHGRGESVVDVARSRATVTLIEPGQEPPEHFDHLLVVGPGQSLAGALETLDDPRAHLLSLPCAETVLARVVESALEAAEAFARARVTDQLLEIGLALNAARSPTRVLELILQHSRSITGADAGSIYLVNDSGTKLTIALAVNDSVETDLGAEMIDINLGSVVGTCVTRGTVIRSSDLYRPPRPDESVRHNRMLDERIGYQTRSMITAPMISPEGRKLGVIQLINAKVGPGPLRTIQDFDERIRSFSEEDERLVSSLASQAAVALESARLNDEVQSLFEGFVHASVRAIEQRDPTTSGHSHRVANLTMALALAADRADSGIFAPIRFSSQQMREIEYAGLLHDFGKVGVREEILVKAKKLYPAQLQRVRDRFAHMRTSMRVDFLQAQLDRLRGGHGDDPALERDFALREQELLAMFDLVLEANEPTVLPKEVSSRLHAISSEQFVDAGGRTHRLLEGEELDALLITRGSLTAEERAQIQSHVEHTYDFLSQIPWGSTLARVPEIAGKHHEYLNGSGYPRQLSAPEIPLQARMMTVADIFDALTASDRPYKKAVPLNVALDILHAEQNAGKLDADVLALFIEARIFDGEGP